jgi:hypothetical protein
MLQNPLVASLVYSGATIGLEWIDAQDSEVDRCSCADALESVSYDAAITLGIVDRERSEFAVAEVSPAALASLHTTPDLIHSAALSTTSPRTTPHVFVIVSSDNTIRRQPFAVYRQPRNSKEVDWPADIRGLLQVAIAAITPKAGTPKHHDHDRDEPSTTARHSTGPGAASPVLEVH